ncbi:endonuclease-reverse transcriptase [Elysia marginata]|uniref:Endonuclease-reverse transcriptase n=1 Tax=Elysia marginata TaxID=1093978 RepID=A0AAV4HAL4_9GAST|nr:endonuclease-reverse transcriptase [Elysia marginata]
MKAGTLSTVIKEVRRNKIIICGTAEHRWSGKGHFTPAEGGKIMYSGGDKSGYGGVAVYLDKDCINMMLGYNPVNDRIMSVRLKGTAHNLTIIQTYAPTTQASEKERELFYNCLQQTLDSIQKQDEILIMGDFNATVSKRMSEKECNTIGEYGLGTRNEAGERLVEFCLENNLFVANTMFQNHRRRLYTWTHPDCSRHQIDYILAQNRWRSSIMGVRTLPGADCGTDHELLMAEVKTRLKLLKPGARPIRYDLTELPLNIAYKLEIKNRFDVLGRITEQMEPNDLATEINKIFKETAEKHIPKMKTKKMPWISNKTLHNIEQRREAKKTFGNQSEQYKDWNKEVKNAIKNDKKEYLEKGAVEGRRGRPRRRWTQDISDWLGFSVREASILAQDRDGFRSAVWEATFYKDPP